jgi:ZIP family zinc transporter
MADFLIVLAIALLPAAGAGIGSAIAESMRTPEWVIGASLHAAAGVAIAVVSVDLMPRVLQGTPVWLAITGFLCGAAFSVLLSKGVKWIKEHLSLGGSSGAWMIYMAIAADLFRDGLMAGAGSAVSTGLGLLLGMSQVFANIPGGFAAISNFRVEGVERPVRILIAFAFALPLFVGATVGYWVLRGVGPEIQNAALAFVIGVLLLATVEDTLPQADEPSPPRLISTASFAGGFALFVLFASYLK